MPATIENIDFHGQPALRLTTPAGASAIVSLYGAQVLSWVPAGGKEWIYLSETASFESGKAIRGGVPVCFPQFSNLGSLPKHGLVRTRLWALRGQQVGEEHAIVTLGLTDDADLLAQWPFPFAAELTVAIEDRRLDIELEVENRGSEPLAFTAALHTYLRVKEVEAAQLEGLRGGRYRDAADGDAEKLDKASEVIVDRELDRVYRGAPERLQLYDAGRSLGIYSENFPDVVVWNPWEEKCAALPDMPKSDFRRMLCVEAAVASAPVVVPPGDSWWGRQSLDDLVG